MKHWADAAGRTVKSVTEEQVPVSTGPEQYLVFRFTDGSALVVKYREGGDGPGGGYEDIPDTLEDYWDRQARVYFGIDSIEQYLKEEEESSAKFKAEALARERAQFEFLKLKYGETK